MFSKIVSSVSSAFDFNLATLSGCIDILVVPQEDGTLRSTPFHVRFGKAKLLRSREKIVNITVNWQETDLKMTLGSAGEAYFIVEDTRTLEEIERDAQQTGLAAEEDEDYFNNTLSPLMSPRVATSMAEPPPQKPTQPLSLPPSAPASTDEAPILEPIAAPTSPDGSAQTGIAQLCRDFATQAEQAENPLTPQPNSRVEVSLCGHLLYGIPDEAQHDKDVFQANLLTWDRFDAEPSLWFNPSLVFRFDGDAPYFPAKTALPLLCSWLIFNQSLSKEAFITLLGGQLQFKDGRHPIARLERQAQELLSPAHVPHFARRRARSVSPSRKKGDIRHPRQASAEALNMSWAGYKNLCARLSCYTPHEEETQFGKVDALSAVEAVHGSTLSTVVPHAGKVVGDAMVIARTSTGTGSAVEANKICMATGIVTLEEDQDKTTKVKRYRKSLKPTSEQLASLNLEPGPNPITFSVSSALQGTKTVTGTIYLWPRNAKIVVSDVDGTITRSDVWGQLMPIVGKDWSHPGVAHLFSSVRRHDYKILYLTARAIGQADSTRDYLFGLTQNERNKLPDGPLVLSPDRLFPSFKREVIDRKPYVFKIAALRDIRSLFPPFYNPFYAGFGNRDTDHRAYVHVGIPEARIFIIDPTGHVHHVNKTFAKTYESMSEMATDMFPALNPHSQEEIVTDDEFNTFNFWRLPPLLEALTPPTRTEPEAEKSSSEADDWPSPVPTFEDAEEGTLLSARDHYIPPLPTEPTWRPEALTSPRRSLPQLYQASHRRTRSMTDGCSLLAHSIEQSRMKSMHLVRYHQDDFSPHDFCEALSQAAASSASSPSTPANYTSSPPNISLRRAQTSPIHLIDSSPRCRPKRHKSEVPSSRSSEWLHANESREVDTFWTSLSGAGPFHLQPFLRDSERLSRCELPVNP